MHVARVYCSQNKVLRKFIVIQSVARKYFSVPCMANVIRIYACVAIIHKEIKQSHQIIGSHAYTFQTGNTLSV